MSTEEESKKSGLHYTLLVGSLIVIVIAFFTVPFATIGLTIRKSGLLGERIAKEAAAQSGGSKQLDLSSLRVAVEKAAEAALHDPNIKSVIKLIDIEVPTAATMEKTKMTVSDVLKQNDRQFVEAIDPDQIRIIVILKSKDWPSLESKLMEAADLDGFIYRGPSATKTAGNADTVVAEIEIHKR